MLPDARAVLRDARPVERDIKSETGVWFTRRVLPYHAEDDKTAGVVITFTDISERKRIARALEAAKQLAEQANIAKSRFLAVASHDLRQPLQTLSLVQGLLAKIVQGGRGEKLVARLDETVGAMAGMLNTLLDINQIEAGTVSVELADFPIKLLLERLSGEFKYLAQSKNLELDVVPCSLLVRSDPRLLEQMVRNLLSNALKYTSKGRLLLGCRRHAGALTIEIWDTGVGIAEADLGVIFEEYHQVGNAAREAGRGLGLGLSIVQRLGQLLGHPVKVRSWPGRGSVFSVEVMLPLDVAELHARQHKPGGAAEAAQDARRRGSILVVEDDHEVRELLELLLVDDGHTVATAYDGPAALELLAGGLQPDLVLSDYNLPNGLNGLQVVARVAELGLRHVPAIILTGDISTGTLRDIAMQKCIQLNKPVKVTELIDAVQRMLPDTRRPAASPPPAAAAAKPTTASATSAVYVVDDDNNVRLAIRAVLEQSGHAVFDFASGEAFLAAYRPGAEGCLLVDANMPGMSGLEVMQRLSADRQRLPAVMITGFADVAVAVEAMKAGAIDFIEKPIGYDELLGVVDNALGQARDSGRQEAVRANAARQLAGLTGRQREIMDMVLAGHPSKNIAADLKISQRTVENHRAAIMQKTGAKSLPALARLALSAVREADTGQKPK